MKGSWRTTLTGVLTIVGAVISAVVMVLTQGFEGEVLTAAMTALAAGVATGVGLLSARDDKVSSEQAGAKSK